MKPMKPMKPMNSRRVHRERVIVETAKMPVYIRPDFHEILKLRSFLENKKLYQLTEELLAPHIERYKTSKAILERETRI